jgi:hypothetical protein
MIWPFTGRTGGSGEHHLAGGHVVPVGEPYAPARLGVVVGAGEQEAGDPLAEHRYAEARDDRGEGPGHPPGVHPGVVLGEHAAGDGGGEHRLEAAALAPGEPGHVQPEAAHEGAELVERRHVVGVERDGERAVGAVVEVDAGGVGELGGERRPPPQRFQADLQQGLVGVGHLAHRGEHARRRVRGARAGGGIDHRDAPSVPYRAPGHGEPDDPAADHEHVRGRSVDPGVVHEVVSLPSPV